MKFYISTWTPTIYVSHSTCYVPSKTTAVCTFNSSSLLVKQNPGVVSVTGDSLWWTNFCFQITVFAVIGNMMVYQFHNEIAGKIRKCFLFFVVSQQPLGKCMFSDWSVPVQEHGNVLDHGWRPKRHALVFVQPSCCQGVWVGHFSIRGLTRPTPPVSENQSVLSGECDDRIFAEYHHDVGELIAKQPCLQSAANSSHQHNHISYIHYWGRAVKLVILCPHLDIVTTVTWALYVKKPLPDHSDVTSNGSNAPKSIFSGATPYVGRNPLQSWQP